MRRKKPKKLDLGQAVLAIDACADALKKGKAVVAAIAKKTNKLTEKPVFNVLVETGKRIMSWINKKESKSKALPFPLWQKLKNVYLTLYQRVRRERTRKILLEMHNFFAHVHHQPKLSLA